MSLSLFFIKKQYIMIIAIYTFEMDKEGPKKFDINRHTRLGISPLSLALLKLKLLLPTLQVSPWMTQGFPETTSLVKK
jgi:hypothetical protein